MTSGSEEMTVGQPAAAVGADDDPGMLRALIDSVPLALGYWDADLRTLVLNTTAAHWLGLRPADARGLHAREVLGEDAYAKAEPHIKAVLGGSAVLFEFDFVDASGVLRHGVASLSPRVVDGRVVGLSASAVDRRVRGDLVATLRHGPRVEAVEGVLVERLTERERDVLLLLPSELSTTQMAMRLAVSTNTVKTHLRAVYRKLGVNSRRAAVARGIAAQLLDDEVVLSHGGVEA